MPGLFSILDGNSNVKSGSAGALLAEVDDEGAVILDEAREFQYWPSTLEDSLEGGWQSKGIPGLNRPLQQNSMGEDRTISFTASFSADMDGKIGSEVEEDKHNVDLNAAAMWLRSLLSNDYTDVPGSGKMWKSPPVLWLYLQGTQLGYNLTLKHEENEAYTAYESGLHCHMRGCNITYKKWFPSGRPKLMEVGLTFAETIQIGRDIYAYGRSDFKWGSALYTRTRKHGFRND